MMGPEMPTLSGVIALDLFAERAITVRPMAHELVVETDVSLQHRMLGAKEVPGRAVRDAKGWNSPSTALAVLKLLGVTMVAQLTTQDADRFYLRLCEEPGGATIRACTTFSPPQFTKLRRASRSIGGPARRPESFPRSLATFLEPDRL